MPVVPMIGSFHSEGDEPLSINGGATTNLFARIDFGVPVGTHQMRLVLKTTDKQCLISSTFTHEVPPRSNDPRVRLQLLPRL